MKFVALLSILAFCVACTSTKPSGYAINQDNGVGGITYLDLKDAGHAYTKVSVFNGNGYTNSTAAFVYSWIAAYDYCQKQKKTLYASEPQDFSEKIQTTQTSSSTTLVSNYQGNYTPITHYYSYPVEVNRPNYATYFACYDRIPTLNISNQYNVEPVSKDIAHALTGDFKDAVVLRLKNGLKEDPKFPLKDDDLIISINEKRITDYPTLAKTVLSLDTVKEANVRIARGKKIQNIKMKVVDITLDGITMNNQIAKAYCEALYKTSAESIPKLCTLFPQENSN